MEFSGIFRDLHYFGEVASFEVIDCRFVTSATFSELGFEDLAIASSFGIILVKFDFWTKLLGDNLEFYRNCLGRTSSQI